MRITKTSPLRLWVAGQAQNPVGLDIPVHDFNQYGIEGIIGNPEDEDEEDRPIFSSPVIELNERCLAELNAIAPNPSNYQIDQYVINLEIIKRYSGNEH